MLNLDEKNELHKVAEEVGEGVHKEAERAVEKLEDKILRKTITSNKALFLQTVALIITLIGIAIAAEHRITTVEVKAQAETEARVEQNQAMLIAIQKLQDASAMLAQNQVKVATILESIEKRHDLIDQRKAVAKANAR